MHQLSVTSLVLSKQPEKCGITSEAIECNVLWLDGALQLLMNLRTLNDRDAFLNKWDKSLEPLVELVAEDLTKIFNQVDAFNSRLTHILESMSYQDSGHRHALHLHYTTLMNTETGLHLQEELQNMPLVSLKTSFLQCICHSSLLALQRSIACLR